MSAHPDAEHAVDARPSLEARLAADETRLEADEAEVRENRIVAWFAVAIALALVIAVTALVISVAALHDDVGTLRRSTPPDSVGTLSLRSGAVTAEKLAPGAVGRSALAREAVGPEQLAPGAVTGAAVAGNALTGADISEPSLGQVPAARTAHDSARLDGHAARAFLSSVVDVRSATTTDARRSKGPLVARCPSGTRVLSGGARIRGAVKDAALVVNAPDGDTGWTATARVTTTPARTWRLVVSAVCAAGGE
ncbi:MAG TPA: hypothetical protein VNS09_20485 [Solirubrobacter sp.]|nr:hypothetical protein [Solirubrobacter sp.]